jgi:hypothetical protein
MARITDINDLLFPVELHPVFTEFEINGRKIRIEVPNNKIVVNSKSGKPFGVVSSTYKLITNHEAIKLGKRCAEELFGSVEADNIEIFNVDAPSTASYCHIDLVHKNYIMNLWDEEKKSDLYIPYIRITNSYNTLRALRFDIGFCRKICLNGVVFESETIQFMFSHVKHELNRDISFALEQEKVKALFDKFVSYANSLRKFQITTDNSMKLITTLFGIKNESEIDFKDKKEDRREYDSLNEVIENKLKKYIKELGETGYSLFNVITDIASHPIDNRYFRRDMNTMQRLAGNWINSFQEEIQKPTFNILEYLQLLKESPNKALHLSSNRYVATSGEL